MRPAMLGGADGGSDWPEWASAIGTLVAAGIALALGLGLREWLSRPSLSLSSADDDPSSRIVMVLTNGRVGGWARIQVSNKEGRATARGVHVRIAKIEKWVNGTWVRERSELDARELAWANTPSTESVDIPGGSMRPLDFLAALDRNDEVTGAAAIRLEIADWMTNAPSSGAHAFLEAGSWRLELVVAGDNVKAARLHLALGFSAEWWDPDTGKLWTNTVVIVGPSSRAPTEPVVAPTVADMLASAAKEDAESEDG